MISVIIPVLNEEKQIEGLLSHLATWQGDFEILFADGGSSDNTVKIIGGRGKIITAPRGRAFQCNVAAEAAKGEVFFFLHCDSRLAADAVLKIERAVGQGAAWGCFTLRFDDKHFLMSIGSLKSNLRVRFSRIVFGDQGIFMTRELFGRIGGFPLLPIMEDYQLSLNLKQLAVKPLQINSVITTSARRFQAGGRLKTAWLMHRLRRLYRKGVAIEEIADYYKQS